MGGVGEACTDQKKFPCEEDVPKTVRSKKRKISCFSWELGDIRVSQQIGLVEALQ